MSTPLQNAGKTLKKLVDDLWSISASVERSIKDKITTGTNDNEKEPPLVVEPKLHIHNCPPPYPLTDLEFDTLTKRELRVAMNSPVIVMIILKEGDLTLSLFYGALDIKTFRPIKIVRSIQAIIDNPYSYLWFALAAKRETLGIGDIGEVFCPPHDENEPPDTSDPNWWKKGKKP